jgi:hypothetical protein
MSMRLKGEIIGKVGGKNFRSGMREMGWVRGGRGLTLPLVRTRSRLGCRAFMIQSEKARKDFIL